MKLLKLLTLFMPILFTSEYRLIVNAPDYSIALVNKVCTQYAGPGFALQIDIPYSYICISRSQNYENLKNCYQHNIDNDGKNKAIFVYMRDRFTYPLHFLHKVGTYFKDNGRKAEFSIGCINKEKSELSIDDINKRLGNYSEEYLKVRRYIENLREDIRNEQGTPQMIGMNPKRDKLHVNAIGELSSIKYHIDKSRQDIKNFSLIHEKIRNEYAMLQMVDSKLLVGKSVQTKGNSLISDKEIQKRLF
jgi:hypothetical protein